MWRELRPHVRRGTAPPARAVDLARLSDRACFASHLRRPHEGALRHLHAQCHAAAGRERLRAARAHAGLGEAPRQARRGQLWMGIGHVARVRDRPRPRHCDGLLARRARAARVPQPHLQLQRALLLFLPAAGHRGPRGAVEPSAALRRWKCHSPHSADAQPGHLARCAQQGGQGRVRGDVRAATPA